MATNRPLVVVAASARALAECLRRAGLPADGAPLLAVDAFGDDDLRAAVDGWQPLVISDLRQPDRVVAAVDAVLNRAAGWGASGAQGPSSRGRSATGRADVLLGGGFDGSPGVLRALAARHRLLNAPPEAWLAARDPLLFRRLGVSAPETAMQPPADLRGWLRKDSRGSAGMGVMPALAGGQPPGFGGASDPGLGRPQGSTTGDAAAGHAGVFWQRRIAGTPVSLLFCAHSGGVVPVGINRQWCSAAPGLPFAFGGIASAFDAGPGAYDALLDAATRITAATGLRGLASVDAILDRQGRVQLLEVNPRPTASVELYDRGSPGLLAVHIAATAGEVLPVWQPAPGSRALALLRAPVTVSAGEQPRCASDWRRGSVVHPGEPLCTLHAVGPDALSAMTRVRAAASRLRCRLRRSVQVAAPDGEGFSYNPAEPAFRLHPTVT